MPAPPSMPMIQKIKQLHNDGERIAAIAEELGLHRNTIARYTREADKEAGFEASDVPAMRFDADQVDTLIALAEDINDDGDVVHLDERKQARLAALLEMFISRRCECGASVVVLVSQVAFRCSDCGSSYAVKRA